MKEEKIKKFIQTVLSTIEGTDVEEIEITQGEISVRIKRHSPGKKVLQFKTPATKEEEEKIVSEKEEETEGIKIVRSPFVGTFYRAPSPDSEPFVQEGDVVKEGQVLCIIEAMKVMNEVESECSGRILRILAENGQPVEFNQPLFEIELEAQ